MLFEWEQFGGRGEGEGEIYLEKLFLVVLSDKTNSQTSFSSLMALS